MQRSKKYSMWIFSLFFSVFFTTQIMFGNEFGAVEDAVGSISKAAGEDATALLKDMAGATGEDIENLTKKLDTLYNDAPKSLKDDPAAFAKYRAKATAILKKELGASSDFVKGDSLKDKIDDLGRWASKERFNMRMSEMNTEGLSAVQQSDLKELGETSKDYVGEDRGYLSKKGNRALVKMGRGLRAIKNYDYATGFKNFLSAALPQLIMIVAFTLPSIMQQAIQDNLQREAALKTVCEPIQFGPFVLQVVDPCIDTHNPALSVPLYITVPVSSTNAGISPQITNDFGGTISGAGPSKYNSDFEGKRYNTSNSDYYQYAQFFMSYPSQSYDHIGQYFFTDPQFSGQIVSLNTGYAIDSTGELLTAPPPPPLIKMVANNPQYQGGPISSILSAFPRILEQMGSAGNVTTYGPWTGSHGGINTGSLNPYFDSKNIKTELKNFDPTVSDHGAICLIVESLYQYKQPVTFGNFGNVYPLFGWGNDGISQVITQEAFPLSADISLSEVVASGGIVTLADAWNVSAGKMTATKSTPQYKFASKSKNYAALGCLVYLCSETPFAKSLGGTLADNTPTGPYADYVIFLDDEGNQVPLQTTVLKSIPGNENVQWPIIGLNPNAKYMVSLIGSGLANFQSNGQPVAYEQDGTEVIIPELSTMVQGAISALQKDPSSGAETFSTLDRNLYAQFQIHSQALLTKYHSGPFIYGNDSLTEAMMDRSSDATKSSKTKKKQKAESCNLIDDSGNSVLRVYQGCNCYGTSGSDAVGDLLVAVDSTQSPVSLPNQGVAQFMSLVTDIVYAVQPDGSLQANSKKAFANAPGTWNGKTFTLDSSQESTLAWLPNIYQLFEQNGVKIDKTRYDNLTAYVKKQRDLWAENFQDSQLVQGIKVENLFVKLASELDSQMASENKFFVYDVSPSPSEGFVSKDWFVFVDSQQPTLSKLKDQIVDSAKLAEAKALLSLVTGTLYDMKGNPLKDKNGRLFVLSTSALSEQSFTIGQDILQYFKTVYPVGKGMSDKFEQAYQKAIDSFALVENRVMSVGSFGAIPLEIYAGDFSFGNYVYFSSSDSLQNPTDLLVTFDSKGTFGKPFVVGKTQYIISLVSGQVYGVNGPEMVMPMDQIMQYTKADSVYWRSWLKDLLARLQVAYKSQKDAEEKEKEALDQKKTKASSEDKDIAWTPEIVQEIITRLQAMPFLPVPYDTLKQDPNFGCYVRIVPYTESDGTKTESYTFFDIPLKDSTSGKVGAIFTSKGEFVQELKGSCLEAFKHQYGLYGDSTKLGVPLMQPSILMDQDDMTMKPGANGSSMVVSSSLDFPGRQNIKLPSGYYLYFGKNMNSYYVLDVENNQWVDLAGGHLYNRQGQPIAMQQSVAVNKKVKKGDVQQLLLLEQNSSGLMQGLMADPSDNDMFVSWTNTGKGVWKSSSDSVNVKESGANSNKHILPTSYSMTFSDTSTIVYSVDTNYRWQSLTYLPISSVGSIVSNVDSTKSSVCLITYKDKITYVVWSGILYKVVQSNGNSYEIAPFDASTTEKTNTLTVALLVDKNTNAPYVKVSDKQKAKEYWYGYDYASLSNNDIEDFNKEIVQGSITVCPASFEVGTGQKDKKQLTYTLFIPNIADVSSLKQVDQNKVLATPAKTSVEYQVFSNMLFRVLQSADGRWFATLYENDGQSIHEPFISYFNNSGYVDLRTGALFDSKGEAIGLSLVLDDWLSVLNKLQVTVNVDKTGKPALFYRRPSVIKTQEEQQGVSKSSKTKGRAAAG
ncbi:hypothetical protein HYV11_01710 [Candidatus Dependentiae bacterium]|nr:hypothetical protein [Candidatus Dependentiae bacterium]